MVNSKPGSMTRCEMTMPDSVLNEPHYLVPNGPVHSVHRYFRLAYIYGLVTLELMFSRI